LFLFLCEDFVDTVVIDFLEIFVGLVLERNGFVFVRITVTGVNLFGKITIELQVVVVLF
jgi:hypothetical protein